MAKRKLSLVKAPAIEPEIVDQQERIALLDQAPPPEHIKPLSANEKKRRIELEGIVTQNFQAFYEVGCALREIHQRHLYRTTHDRFQEYLKDLWDMARCRAYQLIESADVVDNLKLLEMCANGAQSDPADASTIVDKEMSANGGHAPTVSTNGRQNLPSAVSPIGDKKHLTAVSTNCRHGHLPANECQARALSKYQPHEQRTIWKEAVESAPDGRISASHIKKTARRLNFEKVKEAVVKAKTKANRAPRISEDFRRAYNAFLDQINIERANEWKHTEREEALRALIVVQHAIEAEL